ncbi:MAG TPA: hypothetical protein VFJ43_16390, partial [Bacteroidia bacterium]|nr:hypothetical protein [Bacteroidia bacterium]
MKRIVSLPLFAFLALLLAYAVPANAFDGKSWSSDWSTPKVFIENKGQFPVTGSKNPDVLYAYDNGSTLIYFKRDGFSYSFLKKTRKEDEKDEHIRN